MLDIPNEYLKMKLIKSVFQTEICGGCCTHKCERSFQVAKVSFCTARHFNFAEKLAVDVRILREKIFFRFFVNVEMSCEK